MDNNSSSLCQQPLKPLKPTRPTPPEQPVMLKMTQPKHSRESKTKVIWKVVSVYLSEVCQIRRSRCDYHWPASSCIYFSYTYIYIYSIYLFIYLIIYIYIPAVYCMAYLLDNMGKYLGNSWHTTHPKVPRILVSSFRMTVTSMSWHKFRVKTSPHTCTTQNILQFESFWGFVFWYIPIPSYIFLLQNSN